MCAHRRNLRHTAPGSVVATRTAAQLWWPHRLVRQTGPDSVGRHGGGCRMAVQLRCRHGWPQTGPWTGQRGPPRVQQASMSRSVWVPSGSAYTWTVVSVRRAEVWPVTSVALVAYLARYAAT